MKYQNNKDLAEAQYYLKMLDDFCKSGQVKIPDSTGTAMPWNLKEDPLKDYLIHLFTLKVTIEETGEEVQKFVRQVVNSKIKSKVFYDSVGKFIVECVHHMRFQRQRAWTESHRADDVLDWAPFKRMDEQVWLPLLDQLEQEHAEDGFDKPFFLKLMTGDGASKPENWERLVRDWKVCIDHQVLNKLKDFISLRQNNFETGLVRMMDQITRNMKTKDVSEQRAVQAWELMTNGWTETEFERRLNQVKIQDKYPEIKEIVAKMGRVADANGKDRLTIASGVEMKMEHSAGSDIEGITVGDDLNSLLPLELAQYSDEDMEGLFIYKYRTRRLHLSQYVWHARKDILNTHLSAGRNGRRSGARLLPDRFLRQYPCHRPDGEAQGRAPEENRNHYDGISRSRCSSVRRRWTGAYRARHPAAAYHNPPSIYRRRNIGKEDDDPDVRPSRQRRTPLRECRCALDYRLPDSRSATAAVVEIPGIQGDGYPILWHPHRA